MGICESSSQAESQTQTQAQKGIIPEQKDNLRKKEENFITAEIYIKEDEVNNKIRIINSYDEYQRIEMFKPLDVEKMNEEEIKTCKIQINESAIPFNYFHIFQSAGNYRIKYSFKDNLTKTNFMFFGCKSLTKIDFANFNTQNVDDMECMFHGCSSLKELNISNFNTQKVTNMGHMFYGCSLLSTLNLSNFDTSNVTSMSCMFEHCESLKSLDLSNFNVQKVNNMVWMFCDCSALEYLNLSNFKIQENAEINDIFEGCYALKKEYVIINDQKLAFELFLQLKI